MIFLPLSNKTLWQIEVENKFVVVSDIDSDRFHINLNTKLIHPNIYSISHLNDTYN